MAINKRYYWIKLKEEFFTDKRIKRLRKISGGDTYTIIYLKLLLLSLKDEGKLYYDGVESDFTKELALTIDETCLLYTSPSPRDKRQSRMPSSA